MAGAGTASGVETGGIDVVALARDLIRCPSVTPDDAGALGLLQRALEPLGFVCHRLRFDEPGAEAVDNLYARCGTAAPNFCFAGHTDVVPAGDEGDWSRGPFAAEIADGVLYGRGASDMKGALAAFAAAAAGFLAGGAPRGSISLLITGDEEGPAVNGTRKVLDWMAGRGETIDACLVGEPTNPESLGDMVKIGRRGSLSCTLTVEGAQGHVAYPHLADNPATRLVRMLAAAVAKPLDSGTGHFQPSNLEITDLEIGNPAANVIPRARPRRVQPALQRQPHRREPAGMAARNIRFRRRPRSPLHARPSPDRRGVPHPAGGVERHHRRRRGGGDRAAARTEHHGRHLGRALHQGRVPGGRIRPGRADHAPHRRMRGGGRPAPAGGDLPRRARPLFRLVKGIAASLRGALRLAARDPRGLEYLDLSIAGFWRSFLAAAVALPLFLVERRAAQGVVAALDPGRETPPLAAELTVYALGWPLAALVLLGLCWLLGKTDRFAVLVIALNWLSVLTMGIVCAGQIVVLAAPHVLGLFMAAVYIAVLVIEFRVVRIALVAAAPQAIGVVAATTLFGVLFPGVVLRLFG